MAVPLAEAAPSEVSDDERARKVVDVHVFRGSTGRVRVAFEVDDELLSALVQNGLLRAAETESDEALARALHELLHRVSNKAEKPDFPKIIAAIKAGLARQGVQPTDYRLARMVSVRIGRQVSRRSIENAEAGTVPQHDVGEALLKILGQFTRELLPVEGA